MTDLPMTTPDPKQQQDMEREFSKLTSAIVQLVIDSPLPSEAKAFAAIAAAAVIVEPTAASNDYLRGRLASAASTLLSAIDKRLTLGWQSNETPPTAH